MAKNNNESNGVEKSLLIVLSLISVGLLVAIVYVWYSVLSSKEGATKPGDFLKTGQTQTAPQEAPAPEASESSTAQNQTSPLLLNLTSPKDQEVVSTKTITLKGITVPNALITITGDLAETAVSADEKGNFSQEVNLIEGDNIFTVTAFNDAGVSASQMVTVIYIQQ